MTKNSTRKSLAIGTSALLVAAGVGALPASAAAGLVLTDQNATGKYQMIGGESFTLSGAGNADFVGDAKKLRFKVTNIDGVALDAAPTITLDGGTSDVVDGANQALKADGTGTDSSLGSTAGDTAVFALATGDGAAVDSAADGASIMTNPVSITIAASPADDTTASYKVELFYDADNDGVLDAGELSASQTVTFVHVSDVAVAISMDALTENELAVGADVTLANVDVAQLTASEFGVKYTKGDGTALGTQNDKLDLVALSTDKSKFESDLTVTALAEDTYVKAQLIYKAGGSPAVAGTDGVVVGGTTYGLTQVVAEVLGDLTGSVVVGNTVNSTNFKPESTFQIKALVEDGTTGAADTLPVAGQVVKAKVEVRNVDDTAAETLTSTKYVTVNGTAYTTAASLPGATAGTEIELVSDADGYVYLTIATVGLEGTAPNDDDDTNSVKVTFTAENQSDSVHLEARDAAYTAYVVNHDTTSAETEDGRPVAFQVRAYDQYGGVPADDYDVRAVWVSSGQTTASTSATTVVAPMVGGAANFSITDNGTGEGANVYTLSVEDRAVGGGYVANSDILASSETDGSGQFTINVVDDADIASIAITNYTLSATTGKYEATAAAKSLQTKAINSADTRDALQTAPTIDGTAHTVAGTLSTAGSATVAKSTVVGGTVTFTGGANTLFKYTDSASKVVWGAGSITTPVGAAGAFSVDVYSQKAGSQDITITSGSVSVVVTLNDYADADDEVATSLVIDAADYAAPGSTVIVKATLTDAWGNPVKVAAAGAGDAEFDMSYVGPGLAVTASADATDADGMAQVAYFLGSNDTGTITITARYDYDNDGVYTDALDIVVVKTITIGTAGNTGDVTTWTKKLDDTSLKMYAKNVIGAGKVQFLVNGDEIAWTRANDVDDVEGATLRTANGAYYLVRTVDDRYLVSGRNVLTIVVDGVTTTTRIFYMD